MKKMIALLSGLVLFAAGGVALAHGHGGGSHGGGGFHGGNFHGGHPVFVGHAHFVHHPVFVSGAVVVGSPFFYGYPYYYPPYYPSTYGDAYDSEPQQYIEQPQQSAEPLFYCPDYRAYYPAVQNCPSQWLQVAPNPGGYSQ
jgi:hypothetical protein